MHLAAHTEGARHRLLLDPDTRLQEQVFHVLRHIADGVEDVDFLFAEMGGSEELLGNLSEAMESENEDVVLQVSILS